MDAFCSAQHGAGSRFLYFRRRLYRYVADEQKKAGKLDLVDHHRFSFRAAEFFKTPCFYRLSIYRVPCAGHNGIYYLEEENRKCKPLEKLLLSVRNPPEKAR